ncbi:MAG: Maf family protein [Anaerolineaceae bacterium]
MHQQRIILASSSPRRRELISWMNIPFEVTSADIDERYQEGEHPIDYVRRVACEKAEAIFNNSHFAAVILAADTIVIHGEHILGKPKDKDQATEMLLELRGVIHQVVTAVCLIQPDGKKMQDLCVSNVRMRNYSDQEIRKYVSSGDSLDKAGAYAIQNGSFDPVSEFKGCFASVMGFPFCHIERNLRKIDGYNCVPTAELCQKNLHYSCPIYARVLNGEDIG